MKVNFDNILIVLSMILCASLIAIPASAQDENDPVANEYKDLNQNSDLNLNDDKSILNDHDRSSRSKDSTHVRTIATPQQKIKSSDQARPSSAKEEDALSFNFLYYIIQKFKISDLVDD